ncbi:slightly ste11-like protein [Paramarasmius palmivorus]|uniref:Slightly ste11-like protein n=1 Tax=Paramarasmius palmivorus TaxID=297713 RepID=A0AAW0CHD6_9AGAR
MLTTRSRIQGWEPARSEGDEVILSSQPCQIFTFNVAGVSADTPHTYSESSTSSSSCFRQDMQPVSEAPNPRKGSPGWIPRPRNPFIIFRCDYVRKHSGSKASDKSLSKRAAEAWRCLPAKDKEYYLRLADDAKVAHERMYPDYVYKPRKRVASGPVGCKSSSRKHHPYPTGQRSCAKSQQPVSLKNDGADSSRRRSTSLPLKTPSIPFLVRPEPPTHAARRAMSVEKSTTQAQNSPVDTSIDGTEGTVTAVADMVIPEPSEGDGVGYGTSPLDAVSSSLTSWDGVYYQSSNAQVMPFEPYWPPDSTCTSPSTASTTHHYCYDEAHTGETHVIGQQPWQHETYTTKQYPYYTAYPYDTQLGEVSLHAAARGYALGNFERGMNEYAATNGDCLAFDMSYEEEQKVFEGFIRF